MIATKWNGPGLWRLVLCSLVAGCLTSCAQPAQRVIADASSAPALKPDVTQPCSLPDLVELWQQRKAEHSEDFAIGPGDVITISVPEVDELTKQEVRVSSDGTIGLSLIGTMKVAGMNENELKAAIVRKLAEFMKYPRVDLFVERYQTREVAVTGAVQKPGRYDLANMDQSITDMIGRAGGMTADSAQKVVFIPAKFATKSARSLDPAHRSVVHGGIYRSAALEDKQQQSPEMVSDAGPEGRSWISIDLENPQAHSCLDLPTRPGDVIVVPIAGEVMVQGWVKNPGAFKITPNMTVLGAVSAAGGAAYSASAEILRTDAKGKYVAARFDLTQLAGGEQTDIPVQSGDVVVVEPTLIGAIPFVMSEIFNHFGTGLYIPVP